MKKPADSPTRESYDAAYDAWRRLLGRYIELARQGANAAVLRQAAAAVHDAALRKGQLARTLEDHEH
jgi:hypothetical protein